MSPKLQFLNRIKTGGVTTPQAVLPRPIAPKAAPLMTPPKPAQNYQGPTAQTQSVQDALAQVKRNQQTYGVPGAR